MSNSGLYNYLKPGAWVGEFIVIEPLPQGAGGMATVCLAKPRHAQGNVPDRVALKISLPEHQNFLKHEARFLQQLNHPHVVRAYPLPKSQPHHVLANVALRDIGQVYYYAMEYLGGDTVRARLDHRKRLSVYEAVTIACQLASALEHCHGCRIINLDIKPDNILFRQRRRFGWDLSDAVLCDFGVARSLVEPGLGIAIGSIPYLSPEQVREMGTNTPKNLADQRSDIFSLGVLLYEMITGAVPFENIALVADAQSTPIPPSKLVRTVSPQLNEVILKALAKDPAHRFQSAEEMRQALQAVPRGLYWRGMAQVTTQFLVPAMLIGGVLTFWQAVPPVPPSVEAGTATQVTVTAGIIDTVTPTMTLAPTVTLTTTSSRSTATLAPTRTATPTPRPTFTPTRTPEASATPVPQP
jgi:eukaryotic-like serine/threonine-protein kinase